MAKGTVKILCDSCVDLPRALVQEHGIAVIPLIVTFGTESFKDGVDISADEFFTRLRITTAMPTTSQVTPGEYAGFFADAVRDGSEAIYIGLSSGVSGSLQSAQMAASAPELAGHVHIVDSLGASTGFGLMVLRAAEWAAEGRTAAEIIKLVEGYRDRLCHVITLDTLEYVHRGGRVSAVAFAASKLLDVKPILHMDMAGKLVPFDRVRGRKRSLNRLLDEIERLGASVSGKRVGLSHAHAEAEALEIAERLKSQYGASEIIFSQIGPVIGTHTGPGCIALFFEGPEGRGEA